MSLTDYSIVALTQVACLVGAVRAEEATESGEGTAVTVYSTADPASFDPQRFIAQQRQGYNPAFAWEVPGFGVVKEVRTLEMTPGLNEVRFTEVAEFIDPTTVSFTDLTDPDGTAVLEQNFEFDLVSPQKLMEKYLGRQVSVSIPRADTAERFGGTLLSAGQGRIVLESDQGVQILSDAKAEIVLGELPGGLITKPTLVWKLTAETGGAHKVRTAYQTNGITWRADYSLVLNETDTKADLGAWVTLMNLSGAAYNDARLKLIAGDVQRIQLQPEKYMYGARARAMTLDMEAAGFEEKAFFEYHLYTLPRRTDILVNTTQQIMLFPTARDVGVEKVMVYYGMPEAAGIRYYSQPQQDRNLGNQSNPKVDVYTRFQNEKKNNLGIPLPRGKVRVYKRDDADGTLEFVGEDLIDHTPKDEKVLIKVGQAFDVVGERTQTDFNVDTSRRTMTESFRIQVRNHKEQAETVIIKENLFRWMTWEITKASDEYEKVDAHTIHFTVSVPADGEKTVTYTVRYTW